LATVAVKLLHLSLHERAPASAPSGPAGFYPVRSPTPTPLFISSSSSFSSLLTPARFLWSRFGAYLIYARM
jgi:hypothetical protein